MNTAQDPIIEQRVDRLLQGAIDPHVHSGPSIAPRSLDHLELLQQASAAGFAAVVTKDHDYSGVMTAALIKKHFPELKTKIYSSIVLNNVVGGFNPYAGEHPVGIPVLNSDKSVRDDVKEVLDVIAKNDMVLASGHLHVSETWLVFEEAKRRGVGRMVLTHPEDIVDASLNDVKGLASAGAFVEHSLCMFLEGSKFKIAGPDDLRRHIEAAGVGQTVFCSDLGQVGTFSPLEGFRRGVKMCIDLGYSDDEIRQMVSLNAARMLGIEADVKLH
jgi:hypothetical protein